MYDVSQQELVDELSVTLKGKIDMPEWARFVKTGVHKQRPPVDDDWWYVRAASVLRQISLKGPIGVSKLRYKYGGRKNNGMKPEHFTKGSGKIIRTILQQLEEAKLVEKGNKGLYKGRILTSEGKSLVFNTAKGLGAKPAKKAEPKKEPKPEKKETKSEAKKDKPVKEEKSESKNDDKKASKSEDKTSKKSE